MKPNTILWRKNNMYINPFWAGVAATISAELAIMFISSLVIIFRRVKK
jgi:hypothetical protein